MVYTFCSNFVSRPPTLSLKPTHPPTQWELKRPGHETDYSPESSAEEFCVEGPGSRCYGRTAAFVAYCATL
jgi:hypothetical protein